MFLRSLPALAAAALCISGAQAQSPFARALPESSIGYLSFPDLGASLSEMQSMPLMKIWREAEVQDFFARAIKMAETEFAAGLEQARDMYESGELPVDPDAILEMRVGSVGVALTQLGVAMPTDTTDSEFAPPKPKIGFLVHMDFGESIDTWREVLQIGSGLLAMQTGMAPEPIEVAGQQVFSLQPDPNDPMGVHYTFVGSNFLFGTLASEVAMVANGLTAEESTGLTTSASFQASAKQVNFQGSEMEMFFRPGPALDFVLQALDVASKVTPEFPKEIDIAGIGRVIDALGLRSVESMSMSSRYVNGTAVSEVYTASPIQSRTGIYAGEARNVDLDNLRWIPKDAVSFRLGSIDSKGLYNTLIDSVSAYAPGFGDMVQDQLGQMEEQIGLSLENDLFGAFGNDFATWSMPFAAMAASPEVVVIADMNNQEGFMNSIRTIEAMSEGALSLNEISRSGLDLFQLRLEIDLSDSSPLPFNPTDLFTPTFGFKDGKIVMALSTSDVKNALRRMDREDDASGDIRSNPEFARYLESHVKGKSFESLSFADYKSSIGDVYQLVAMGLALAPMGGADLPIEPALLPEANTLTKHVFGSISYTQSDENGWRSVSVGPFGIEMPMLIGGAVAAGAAAFGVMSSNEMPIEFR